MSEIEILYPTCIWCSHCYSIDNYCWCYALGANTPDQIEFPFTDTRPCKMYEDREF